MDETRLKYLVKQNLRECVQHQGKRGVIYVYDPASWPGRDERVLITFVPLDQLPSDVYAVVSQRYLSRKWDFDNEFLAALVPSISGKVIRCRECGRFKNLQKCSRCKDAVYCSLDCQRNDWGKHKLQCTPALDTHGHRKDFVKTRLANGAKVELPKNLNGIIIGYAWSMVKAF